MILHNFGLLVPLVKFIDQSSHCRLSSLTMFTWGALTWAYVILKENAPLMHQISVQSSTGQTDFLCAADITPPGVGSPLVLAGATEAGGRARKRTEAVKTHSLGE